MTLNEKKQIRNIISLLIERHNLDEAGAISHLTQNRCVKPSQLHGEELLKVASYLADFERREPIKVQIFELLLNIEEFTIAGGQGRKWVNYQYLTEHLIDNGFTCDLFSMDFQQLLEARSFIIRMYEAKLYVHSCLVTHQLLTELSIQVIKNTRKKKENEKSKKRTPK